MTRRKMWHNASVDPLKHFWPQSFHVLRQCQVVRQNQLLLFSNSFYINYWIAFSGKAWGRSSTWIISLTLWEVSVAISTPLYLGHFLSTWTFHDLTLWHRCRIPIAVLEPDRNVPSFLLPYVTLIAGSGSENPQISVKTQSLSTLHQSFGAYSVQLRESHCNLCHVIIGFRCPPPFRTSQVIWNI